MNREVSRIWRKFNNGWPKMLKKITINNLRGWTGETIEFKFPVTTVVGENGSGKTTALKVATCAYQAASRQSATYFPANFFPVTAWDNVTEVKLEYSIQEGSTEKQFSVRKPTERWRGLPNRPRRHVFFFDITRTQPIDSLVGYARIAKRSAAEVSSANLDEEYKQHLSYILERPYSTARFATSSIDESKKVGILELSFGQYSQFHQGAGEGSTLDLMHVLQDIPQNSLIIIDEVEASLHPKAQRRLINFLLRLARIREHQIIISTHSPYILSELPPDGRVLLNRQQNGEINVINGATPEFALSYIDDEIHPELMVFVEDKETLQLVRDIVAYKTPEILSRIKIMPVGPANVVKTLGKLGAEGKLFKNSIAILDGECENDIYCLKIPGQYPPEVQIFYDLKSLNWCNLADSFGVSNMNFNDYCEEAMLIPDHHEWPNYIAEKILISSRQVWEVMSLTWVKNCLSNYEADEFAQRIKDNLPS